MSVSASVKEYTYRVTGPESHLDILVDEALQDRTVIPGPIASFIEIVGDVDVVLGVSVDGRIVLCACIFSRRLPDAAIAEEDSGVENVQGERGQDDHCTVQHIYTMSAY